MRYNLYSIRYKPDIYIYIYIYIYICRLYYTTPYLHNNTGTN